MGLIHVFFAWANPVEDHAKHVVNEYMDYSLVLIQNTVGFSAPVSARMYAYVAVGAHEAAVDFSPDLISLEGKLANYVRPQFSFTSENCALPVVLNEVYFQLFTYMFRGAPPHYLKELSLLHSSLDDSSTKTFSRGWNHHDRGRGSGPGIHGFRRNDIMCVFTCFTRGSQDDKRILKWI